MTQEIVVATPKKDLMHELERALGKGRIGQATSASMLRHLLPSSRVAVIDLQLPGLTGSMLLEVKAATRPTTGFVLLWKDATDIERIQNVPLDQFKAVLLRLKDPHSKSQMERLAEAIGDFASHEHRDRIRHSFYDERTSQFVVIFRDGREYRLLKNVIPGTDDTDILKVRIRADGSAFTVEQKSGNRVKVPWDFVLYHEEPEYEYYKEREDQQDREKRVATHVGKRLRELRKRVGLSTYELARRSGIHRPNISRIEHGKHVPSVDTLERLARALNVPVIQLLNQPSVDLRSGPKRIRKNSRSAPLPEG